MHITLVTWGSRGDIQPFVALGKRILAADHQVRILASKDFKEFITERGIDFAPLSLDFRALFADEGSLSIIREGVSILEFVRRMAPSADETTQFASDIVAASADTDLLIAGQGNILFAVGTAADKLGIPFMLCVMQPILPTRDHPNPMFWQGQPGNSLINMLGNLYVNLNLYDVYFKPMNVARQNLGMRPMSLLTFLRLQGSMPVIHAISPLIYPKPSDFGDHRVIVGNFFLDEPDWQPPSHLEAFLNAGEPPVYIGFGSMSGWDPQETTMMSVDAINQSGQRGLLGKGWGGMKDKTMTDHLFVLDQAPHSWLFPRMKVIVHHGGAGTTAAALRAGVPQVVVPHFVDQPLYGYKMHQLGVAPPAIPRAELTTEKLVNAINAAIPLAHRAAEIGEQIRAEDGSGEAIKFIEKIMGSKKNM